MQILLAVSVASCAPEAGALFGDWSYAFTPDPHFTWIDPTKAQGALIWAHGTARNLTDVRSSPTPPVIAPFSQAGYDVIRFDRAPAADQRDRAAAWLRDGIARLRKQGFRRVIVAGQSRGGWNALQMLDTPDLADGIIALSPAAHGAGASPELLAQSDDFRTLLADLPPSHTRVAVAQFQGDFFIGDADTRADLLRRAAPRFGALLLIDRPSGFGGHKAGDTDAFARQYGDALLRFMMENQTEN